VNNIAIGISGPENWFSTEAIEKHNNYKTATTTTATTVTTGLNAVTSETVIIATIKVKIEHITSKSNAEI
jgi:hypothetical protein